MVTVNKNGPPIDLAQPCGLHGLGRPKPAGPAWHAGKTARGTQSRTSEGLRVQHEGCILMNPQRRRLDHLDLNGILQGLSIT